mgnify:CR=1 FL=1
MLPNTGAITAEPSALETKVRLLLVSSVPLETVKAPVTFILLFNVLVPECATVKFLVFMVFAPATVTGPEKISVPSVLVMVPLLVKVPPP